LAHQDGGLATCFPLDVPMVHSSALAVATDGEHLTCGGFYLDEIVHFGSLEFIADCFGEGEGGMGAHRPAHLQGGRDESRWLMATGMDAAQVGATGWASS
jgi:hypothetical protein